MTKIVSLLTLLILSLTLQAQAQRIEIERVEPPNWWVGFEHQDVQLLVYGPDINTARASINYPGVILRKTILVENPNYMFLDIRITEDAKPGKMDIVFERGRRSFTYSYELKERGKDRPYAQGFDASDVIYLIMPDRFANGDPTNDVIPGMKEGVDRSEPFARHGGDIRGILDNLDYIEDLGMTAIWFNPILENDMPYDYSQQIGFYHGYAATDKYRVDRRYGTNEEFLELVRETQNRGMRVIMDMIHNHVGTHHWFIKDMPTSDWVHDQSKYGNTGYRTSTIMDPYASEYDYNNTVRAWFVDEMPDLDQRNELLANYLIQNTIWWIEYSGIDGIRMDTHPYPYKDYMAEWARRVFEEYPDFNIVGEVWMPNVATTAFWQTGSIASGDYESYLPSTTDFPLFYAVNAAFNQPFGWDTGVMQLYYVLSQDFLYSDPLLNVIFLDNHDLNRYFSTVGRDFDKFRLGLTFILTTRGIPQIYYGTEILKEGYIHDADKRRDFPGGWAEDPINAFTHEGRVELGEKRGLPVVEAHALTRKLSQWRKNKDVIHFGRLTHFVPRDNAYVYFRHNDEEAVMVVINANENDVTLYLPRFREILHQFSGGYEILSEQTFEFGETLTVPGRTPFVIELKK